MQKELQIKKIKINGFAIGLLAHIPLIFLCEAPRLRG
jgi:hypothetical protein